MLCLLELIPYENYRTRKYERKYEIEMRNFVINANLNPIHFYRYYYLLKCLLIRFDQTNICRTHAKKTVS